MPHRTGAAGFAIGTVDLLPVTLHLKPILMVSDAVLAIAHVSLQGQPAHVSTARTSGRLNEPC